MAPKPPPRLNIPPGTTSVTVSAIDSTLWLVGVPTEHFYDPPIPGFGRVRTGCWSLLIEHPSGRKLLYDLGMRKDWWNCAPAVGIQEYMANGTLESLKVERNVSEILEEGGMDLGSIEGVIWSHFHFDHTGDMSTFPATTKLILGEGSKEAFTPGWPTDPEAQTLDSDFEGREIMEIDFSGGLKIGGFRAYDYFGDGSFYLLDSPGHTIGHVNALARANVNPPEYVHMCGDSAHHCGEIRPTPHLPLPEHITPSPLSHIHPGTCPGGIFNPVLRKGSREEHVLELKDPGKGSYKHRKFALIYDEEKLKETVREVEGFDASEEVFTVLAHDWTLKGSVEEWPGCLNGWRGKGWREEVRWRFLGDWGEAVEDMGS